MKGEKPNRQGTTAGNFLEIGFGGAGYGMGDAVVSSCKDLSAMYWNPARLAYMENSEAQFMYQPWFADINTGFAGAGIILPNIGAFAIGYFQVDYGNIGVTTMDMQEGTGEQYTSRDYHLTLSYARRLAEWFAFGASGKYIGSKIWHCNSSALALDLGVSVNTFFFSPTEKREDGLTIAMSIANYGGRLKYDGMDLLRPIDPLPNENGNYKDVEGQYRTQPWELPLIFRVGFSVCPYAGRSQKIILEVDALHPNNNNESVNIGGQYEYTIPEFGNFYLRCGYKGLFLEDSEYGMNYGAGMLYRMFGNTGIRMDYAYRDMGLLGKIHSYTIGFLF